MLEILRRAGYRLEAMFATPNQRQKGRERAAYALAVYGSSAIVELQRKLLDKRRRKSRKSLRLAITSLDDHKFPATTIALS
ncbi:MAG: hypothetical protein EOO38_16710 [Cytophagaceae bacterium]|nr:MAG: hypothetical protein EOO38_16710 [Cytophagaceae bacterium]